MATKIITRMMGGGLLGLLCVLCFGLSYGDTRTLRVPDNQGLGEGFIKRTPQAQARGTKAPELVVDLTRRNMSHDELRIEQHGLKIHGKPVSSYVIHEKGNLVVAARAPVSHITVNSLKAIPGEQQEAYLVFQHDHQILTPKEQAIGVFDLQSLAPLKFSTKTKLQGIPENFLAIVALDVSGSMSGAVLDSTKAAIKTFLKALPSYSKCQLVTFNTEIQWITPAPANCQAVAMEVDALEAGGNTDLYKAFEQIYLEGKRQPFQHQVLVAYTDGMGQETTVSKEDVVKAKAQTDIKTMVFWAGQYEKDALKDLVEVEVQAGSNLQDDIAKFFKDTAESISEQIALTIQRPTTVTQRVP